MHIKLVKAISSHGRRRGRRQIISLGTRLAGFVKLVIFLLRRLFPELITIADVEAVSRISHEQSLS